jgi:hypothetical protein
MNPKPALTSQYLASLAMLRSAAEACPDELWDKPSYYNRFWHLAYHVLFYVDFYSSRSVEEFTPWTKFRPEYNFLDRLPPPHTRPPNIGEPYSKAEVLEYADYLKELLPGRIDSTELEAPSGFPWLPFNKFELQIYSLRHLQHHAAQLIDRLRQENGIATKWVGKA